MRILCDDSRIELYLLVTTSCAVGSFWPLPPPPRTGNKTSLILWLKALSGSGSLKALRPLTGLLKIRAMTRHLHGVRFLCLKLSGPPALLFCESFVH